MAAERTQPQHSAQEHVNRYAQLFADELQPILKIDGVTENTDLLGAYTEAVLRNLIRRGFQPMRVSRGGILNEGIPLRAILKCLTAVPLVSCLLDGLSSTCLYPGQSYSRTSVCLGGSLINDDIPQLADDLDDTLILKIGNSAEMKKCPLNTSGRIGRSIGHSARRASSSGA